MNVFVLYRPWLPSLRAQSIQVVNSAHALACRGHQVTLCYRPTGVDPLMPYGLEPHPKLTLRALPEGGTFASLAFWVHALSHPGIYLAREKRWAKRMMAQGRRVVVEAHEVDSLLFEERGEDSADVLSLERRVYGGAAAVIANCEGVAGALQERFQINATVIHNASRPAVRRPTGGTGVAYAGSFLPGKDLNTLALAARSYGPISVYGPQDSGDLEALLTLSSGNLHYAGVLQPAVAAERLSQHHTLVLPLGRGLFGEQFTSPLKAFTYLASGVPFVGADTAALRRAVPGGFEPYTPGDPVSMVRALRRLEQPERRASYHPAVRTWGDRAAEVERVLARV